MIENSICKRQPSLVNVGSVQIYCEHFIMTGHTQLYEKANLTGSTVVTGKCPKSKKITFIGRVYSDSDPFFIARTLGTLNGIRTFEVYYRGMIFHSCEIYDYKIEDKGDDFVYVTLTLATAGYVDYNSKG